MVSGRTVIIKTIPQDPRSQIEDGLKSLYKKLGVCLYVQEADLSRIGAEAQGAGG